MAQFTIAGAYVQYSQLEPLANRKIDELRQRRREIAAKARALRKRRDTAGFWDWNKPGEWDVATMDVRLYAVDENISRIETMLSLARHSKDNCVFMSVEDWEFLRKVEKT